MGKYRDYAPALFQGNKIYPEDIAGLIGLPSVGTIWYVDAGSGSDTANNGKSRDNAYKTVTKAYASATADKDDVILIVGSDATGRTAETAAITWAKRRTHLIGAASPLQMNPRAGMSFGSAVVSPCLTISTRSCIFKNITIAQFNDVNILVDLTGDYNYFENVHFAGIANATTGDDTAARIVRFNGSDENTFVNCTFGVDTVIRTAANYTLEFAGSQNNSRNIFKGCLFTMFGDADAPRHILASASGADRFELFEGCIFTDNSDTTSATTQTDAFATDSAGNQGGVLIVKDCMLVGSTGWASTVTGVKILGHSTNATIGTNYSTGINPSA